VSAETVSVVIPVKDGERFLAEAIDSVVHQVRPPEEIVVVDGGSTDRSVEIAKSYDLVRCIEQTGTGLAQAWNQGIEESSGSLVAFLDSDDRWRPKKLQLQVKILETRPEVDAVIGRIRFFLQQGTDPPPGFQTALLDSDHPGQLPSALLVRRETFERLGVFDTGYETASDLDWFARFKDAGLELGVVEQVVAEKRAHDSNLSYFSASVGPEIVQALRRSIHRQRGPG
jgi:glycosyltransferase involved in cell wall biosynthesis